MLRGNNEEHKVIEVGKDYGSGILAKAAAIKKIAGKIDKGYFSTTAYKEENAPASRVRRGKKA